MDPGTADTHEFRFSCDGGTTWTAWGTTSTHSCSTNDNGTRSVKGEVRDDDGGSSSYSASVTVNNVDPVDQSVHDHFADRGRLPGHNQCGAPSVLGRGSGR